jgi:hypothetical protein
MVLSSDEVAEEANDANANDVTVLKSYTFRLEFVKCLTVSDIISGVTLRWLLC